MGEDIKVIAVAWSEGEDELRYRCNAVAPVVLLGVKGPGLYSVGLLFACLSPESPKARRNQPSRPQDIQVLAWRASAVGRKHNRP